MRLVPCLTVDIDPYDTRFGDDTVAVCERLCEQILGGALNAQLLGVATTMQGEDPRGTGPFVLEDEHHSGGDADLEGVMDEAAWTVLVSIADHPELSFGDGGALAIVIPLEDLAAGRYDRLVTDPSMG